MQPQYHKLESTVNSKTHFTALEADTSMLWACLADRKPQNPIVWATFVQTKRIAKRWEMWGPTNETRHLPWITNTFFVNFVYLLELVLIPGHQQIKKMKYNVHSFSSSFWLVNRSSGFRGLQSHELKGKKYLKLYVLFLKIRYIIIYTWWLLCKREINSELFEMLVEW